MKKFLYFAMMAMLAMPLMMSCKDRNPADNPNDNKWTDEEPGSQEWLDDLTTGEDSAKIVDYTDAEIEGIWQCVASIETDRKGNILWFHDHMLTGDLTHGGIGFYMALWVSEYQSFYYRHIMLEGYPVLEETKGTWGLDRNIISFHNKAIPNSSPYIDQEHFAIDFLERERLVLSQQCKNEKGTDCIYYEVWQRVMELPKIDTKLPLDRMYECPWKVTADTLGMNAWKDNEPDKGDKIFVKQTGIFAESVFTFQKDSTLMVKEKGGAVKTYKMKMGEYSDATYVSFTIEDTTWPSPVTIFNVWLPSNETSMKLLGTLGERLPQVEVPKGYDNASLFHSIFLDPVK